MNEHPPWQFAVLIASPAALASFSAVLVCLGIQVGEGLEAEQKDFAAEVAETLKSVA